MPVSSIQINRAPVLTLWASIVAERFGFDHGESLSIGKALAGLTAQSKGKRLGIFTASKKDITEARKRKHGDTLMVGFMGRHVSAVNTEDGIRAVIKDAIQKPEAAQKYIESKFGEHLDEAIDAMTKLAKSYSADDLEPAAFGLYMKFRPSVPDGVKGWGAKGVLDLDLIKKLCKAAR